MCDLYKYIHPPNFEHKSSDVLDTVFKSLDDICGKCVVYRRKIGYNVYSSIEQFLDVLNTLPIEQKVYHEVIFNTPQKLRFDIDCTDDKIKHVNIESTDELDPDMVALINEINAETELLSIVDELTNGAPTEYIQMLNTIIDAIHNAFFISFGFDIPDNNIIICESHGDGKYSNHIILDGYYVNNCDCALEFARRVFSYLPANCRAVMDMSVYKRIQNFRIINCHKAESMRIKNCVTGHSEASCFITNIDNCVELPNIAIKRETITTQLTTESQNEVLQICRNAGIMANFEFKRVRGGIFVFDRISPSYCEFCKRVHNADNTLIISVSHNDGKTTVFKQCKHYICDHGKDGNHVIVIGSTTGASSDIPRKTFDPRKYIAKGTTITQFDSLSDKHIYNEPVLRPFELVPTLVIHAAMKMGKTKALNDHLRKHFAPSALHTPIIRFISFRQTFSGNIKEKFPDFTLYSTEKGPLGQSRLIIQVESLYRLDIRPGSEQPDLLILDECESIFEQFNSGLLRGNFNECFAKFQYLMRYSKHVICMDAGISDRTYNILRAMRDHPITYHHNMHKNGTSDTYYITNEKYKWLATLYASIESDEKVAIPISSLEEAKTIRDEITRRFPDKRIKLYSAETSTREKTLHFSDVNTYWALYDVLIYTPTVSAGVSFEEKVFDRMFCYFTDASCTVETCIQMIGRIRNVSSGAFMICLDTHAMNLPTHLDDIKQMLYTGRANLFCEFDTTGLQPIYGPNGAPSYHEGEYFQIWLENTRVRNLSRNQFTARFVAQISSNGAQIAHIDDIFEAATGIALVDAQDEIDEITSDHKAARKERHQIEVQHIVDAADLGPEDVIRIQTAMIAQEELSEDDVRSYARFKLRSEYNYTGEIDEKFVSKYRDKRIRRIFKNMQRLGVNTNAHLHILQDEQAIHKYLMESQSDRDLNRKYVFESHRYAFGYLKLCGWAGLNDPTYIHKVKLITNLREGEQTFWSTIKGACAEFGLKPPRNNVLDDNQLITTVLGIANRILSIMYGAKISSRESDPDMYSIRLPDLFTTNPDISVAKHIPLLRT